MFFITASFNVAVWLLPIVSNFAQAQWSCQGCPKFNSNWPTTPFKQFGKANTQIGYYRFWIEQPVQVFHWISIPLASSIAGCASLDSSFVRDYLAIPAFRESAYSRSSGTQIGLSTWLSKPPWRTSTR